MPLNNTVHLSLDFIAISSLLFQASLTVSSLSFQLPFTNQSQSQCHGFRFLLGQHRSFLGISFCVGYLLWQYKPPPKLSGLKQQWFIIFHKFVGQLGSSSTGSPGLIQVAARRLVGWNVQDGFLHVPGNWCWLLAKVSQFSSPWPFILWYVGPSSLHIILRPVLWEREGKSYKTSWGLGSTIFTSLLPHSVTQSKSQGQPRSKGLET